VTFRPQLEAPRHRKTRVRTVGAEGGGADGRVQVLAEEGILAGDVRERGADRLAHPHSGIVGVRGRITEADMSSAASNGGSTLLNRLSHSR